MRFTLKPLAFLVTVGIALAIITNAVHATPTGWTVGEKLNGKFRLRAAINTCVGNHTLVSIEGGKMELGIHHLARSATYTVRLPGKARYYMSGENFFRSADKNDAPRSPATDQEAMDLGARIERAFPAGVVRVTPDIVKVLK